jgi:formamidopyrimidine-DNA glycosylase
MKRTHDLDEPEIARLVAAMKGVLEEWIVRLRDEVGEGFPEKVTAFHDEMSVHGRFKKPCRVCGSPVQRIVYAQNECNYCATCQTGGKLLADRALSRLLHGDWPKTLEELEERKTASAR